MVNEKLKEWVKNKREEGVSDERIKQSLKETGHDPSIVDELDDPFDQDRSDSDTDISGQDFSFEDPTQKNSSKDDDHPDTDNSERHLKEMIGEKLDEFSINLEIPDISVRRIGFAFSLLFVLIGGIAIYSFVPSNFNPLESTASGTNAQGLSELDSRYPGCPDSGVRVLSVSSTESSTTADVLVTREEAWVVLQVLSNGEITSYKAKKISGEDQITVDAVGDEVELRPLGCMDRSSRRSY